jgi:hypothetical protein
VFYVERFEALIFEAQFRGVGSFAVPEGTNLHAVIVVFLGRLDIAKIMFFLKAAGDRQGVILLQQRGNL